MILGIARSKNGVTIRLTHERWLHITTSHKEIDPTNYSIILAVIKEPDVVFQGDTGELLAVRKRARKKDWVVVVYKEQDSTDGFVLTTYVTSDFRWLLKRKIVWNKLS
ncbi:hypothetical protein HY032_00070 [Candidatus Gottesmanbacteria bacterium]|nr:hypothetical protein [Candidatus Gottesmanbacteria bacterium]